MESEFSIVEGYKFIFRKSLNDLSLKGVPHYMQFIMLKGIYGALKGFEDDPYFAPYKLYMDFMDRSIYKETFTFLILSYYS